ncbi:Imm21 family immunity protein [Streptomyces albidoflavus]|uniref:Imm21 family immunity protein n=1 Tax=Streptomyces albidoflavus TaxID=1886 RepID=UPI0037B88EA2
MSCPLAPSGGRSPVGLSSPGNARETPHAQRVGARSRPYGGRKALDFAHRSTFSCEEVHEVSRRHAGETPRTALRGRSGPSPGRSNGRCGTGVEGRARGRPRRCAPRPRGGRRGAADCAREPLHRRGAPHPRRTALGEVLGEAGGRDDYDRTCEVGGLAGVISVGTESAGALVLADLPERTCFLPEELLFVRWAGAGSEGALLTAARATPGDPGRPRHRLGGVRGLGHRRSCCADGLGRGRHRPGGGAHRGVPDQAPVPLPAGRWRVLAARRTDTDPGVNVVRLTADQA